MKLKRWTEAIALRMTNARFRRIKKALGEIAYLWGDVDGYAVSLCTDLIDQVEEIRLDIVASAQARVEDREAA